MIKVNGANVSMTGKRLDIETDFNMIVIHMIEFYEEELDMSHEDAVKYLRKEVEKSIELHSKTDEELEEQVSDMITKLIKEALKEW